MIFKNITDIKAAVEAYREAHPAPAVPAGEQRITAALCDMDGTLYDSMSRHSAAWFRLMTELGVECERDEFYLYEGMTGANTATQHPYTALAYSNGDMTLSFTVDPETDR